MGFILCRYAARSRIRAQRLQRRTLKNPPAAERAGDDGCGRDDEKNDEHRYWGNQTWHSKEIETQSPGSNDAEERAGCTSYATQEEVFSGDDTENLSPRRPRSEERRVGKECRSRWS